MARLTKKRCSMCGTKIDPLQLATHGKENFCSQSCCDWFIQTYEQNEEVNTKVEKRVERNK